MKERGRQRERGRKGRERKGRRGKGKSMSAEGKREVNNKMIEMYSTGE